LDGAGEVGQLGMGSIPSASALKIQEDIAVGHGIEPQVTPGALAGHFGVHDFHRGLVDLEVTAPLHVLEHQAAERLEEEGDVRHPLHHLLAGDDDAVSLPKDSFQCVVGDVIVEAGQEQVNRQGHTQFALRQQPGRQRRDLNAGAAAAAGVFGTDRASNNQLGRHVLQFLAGLLTDAFGCAAAVLARSEGRGLDHDGLAFQVFGQRVSATATALTFWAFFVLARVLVFEHLVADRWLPLRLIVKISGDFSQLPFFLVGQPLGALAEELALEFGDFPKGLA
jgi:hypothetical protein